MTILCPVDFSSCSDAAVDLAVGVARVRKANLVLLHVDPPTSQGSRFLDAGESRRDHESWLESRLATARAKLGADIQVDAVTRLASGQPAHHIVEIAREVKAKLIVVASHSSGLRRLLLGSVAKAVAHSAPCPVLLVRGESYVKVPFVRPLACIDFSKLSAPVVEEARQLAAPESTTEFLHVVDDLATAATEVSLGQRENALAAIDLMHSESRRALEDFAASTSFEGKHPKLTVKGGSIAATILTHARETKATLIAVGSHRPEGLRQHVLGTVADRIIGHAPVPVLLCPARALHARSA